MAEEEKAPNPSLPPKLDLSKFSARAAAKPDDAEPTTPTPVSADKPATPSVPRPAATPPGSLPKPGPANGLSTPSASPRPKPDSVRLTPKLQPPPRPAGLTPPDSPAAPAAPVTPAGPVTKPDADKPDADAPAVPAPVPTVSKRETSRIPLDTAQTLGPKTIRIKPIAKPAAPPPTAGDETSAQDAKRRTSRISLESALGGPTDEAAGGPKTIRLKRPAEPGAEKVTPPPAPDSKEAFTKTAPIVDAAASEVPLTQKKTIRVKRPGQSPAGPRNAPVVRRASGVEGGVEAAAMVSTAKVEDRAHWTFITFSIFSVVILIVTVYLFAAQALGPNLSLTRLSYGADGMELPWPGRLYP